MFKSPINKFIRYTTITNENRIINTIIIGLSLGDHADNEFGSPIKLKCNINCYNIKINKTIKIKYLLKTNTLTKEH